MIKHIYVQKCIPAPMRNKVFVALGGLTDGGKMADSIWIPVEDDHLAIVVWLELKHAND